MSENTRASVGIIGAGGRMGESLCRLIGESKDLTLGFGFVRSNKGADSGDGFVSSWLDAPSDINAVIDFSSPELFLEALDFCVERKILFVSGTTGLTEAHFQKLEEASKKIPVLWASNMSLGVQFVNRLLASFSELPEDFKFQMSEWHHIHKKDAPSGTAITLQKSLQKILAEALPNIVSHREGEIFGIHEIEARSNEEVITLKHEALNRDVFSKGALVAVRSLLNKPAGRYYL